MRGFSRTAVALAGAEAVYVRRDITAAREDALARRGQLKSSGPSSRVRRVWRHRIACRLSPPVFLVRWKKVEGERPAFGLAFRNAKCSTGRDMIFERYGIKE